VKDINPLDIKFNAATASQNLTATGCNLSSITGLHLKTTSNQGAKADLAASIAATDKSATFTINSKDLSAFNPSEPKIALSVLDKSGNPVAIAPTLSIEGLGASPTGNAAQPENDAPGKDAAPTGKTAPKKDPRGRN
jgi:hypothetical protein